jgi:hypothetical protein
VLHTQAHAHKTLLIVQERKDKNAQDVTKLPDTSVNDKRGVLLILTAKKVNHIHSSMALQSFIGPWPLLQSRKLFLHRR